MRDRLFPELRWDLPFDTSAPIKFGTANPAYDVPTAGLEVILKRISDRLNATAGQFNDETDPDTAFGANAVEAEFNAICKELIPGWGR